MKTVTIRTRGQLGKYLHDQAKDTAKLYYQRSILRELVAEAHALRDRMPKAWVKRAASALKEIEE